MRYLRTHTGLEKKYEQRRADVYGKESPKCRSISPAEILWDALKLILKEWYRDKWGKKHHKILCGFQK